MRIVFFLPHDGFIRNFEPLLRALTARGHAVHLATGGRRQALMSDADSFESLVESTPRLSFEGMPKATSYPYRMLVEGVYATRNYLRFLEPEYAGTPRLRERAREHAPAPARRVGHTRGLRSEAVVHALERTLRCVGDAVPTDRVIDEYIACLAPDVALVSPLIGFGAAQHSVLRSLKAAGVPTALVVHSWDNLTNKGLIQEHPDRVLVWNEAQKDEAVQLHGIPPDRVCVTGAHSYDPWFAWEPSTTRVEFCARVGLDPARPLLLYVCSSSFIASDEARHVQSWIERLRDSGYPVLADAGVLVRPHPQNAEHWQRFRIEETGRTALWPPLGSVPSGRASRAEYYDTIHHAAAVAGVNTSALLESAIQGRPVFTLLAPEFHETQEGTLHFAHIAAPEGGLLTIARTFDEHAEQLAGALTRPHDSRPASRAFVGRFLRPHGIETPSAPIAVEEIESLGAMPVGVRETRPFGRVAGIALRPAAWCANRMHRKEKSPTAGYGSGASLTAGDRLRILFFMRSINYDRHFEAVLRALLWRGHSIHVAFDVEKKGRAGDSSLFEALQREFPAFTWCQAPARRRDAWATFAAGLRYSIDYLRYLEPEYSEAAALRDRARRRAPAAVTRIAESRVGRTRCARKLLGRTLRGLESAVPTDRKVLRFTAQQLPDLILVTPLVGLGSPQGDFVRCAALLGIPSALLVASWDNLTNKGLIRDEPELTVVWNAAQRDEAVQLHGLSSARIKVTGAHTYDQWFDWEASTTREEFCAKVGLRADQPFVLYVCSSSFIAPDEATFIESWIRRLRKSDLPELRRAGILVRPHPANAGMWDRVDLTDPERTVVWPPGGAAPTNAERKADYYDSIYHCAAVVGINTSALVESAILDRAVLTVLAPEFAETQGGTLHFAHLTSAGGQGLLNVARDMGEHERQLAEVLRGRKALAARNAGFVEDFVRPHGREIAATPLVVDALEELALRGTVPVSRPWRHTIVRHAVSPFVWLGARTVPVLAQLGFGRHAARSGHRSRAPGNRFLLLLSHPGLLIHFDETVRELASRGHTIHVAFARPAKFADGVNTITGAARIIVHSRIPSRRDWYTRVARGVRALADYVHYLQPNLAGAVYSRAKWRALASFPPPLGALARRDALPRRSAGVLLGLLARIEDAIPPDEDIARFVGKVDPDALLVSPLVEARGDQTDYVKAAQRMGVPTCLCVTSWDNLTSKGRIRIRPERVTVWNETQRREAADYHAVPTSSIAVTGAQPFDRWFDRRPSTSRQDFLDTHGLPHGRPFVLFVGSTRQGRAPEAEIDYVRRWLVALRASEDRRVRDVAVLVRPHPTDNADWHEGSFANLGGVAIWRRAHALPIDSAERADYFDGLYHCAAVVGVNSSAMIEAAIVDRPVHTITLPEVRSLQHDLLHYGYLREEQGGFLCEAVSFEEHASLLGKDLRDPGRRRAERMRFVESFVRPAGRETPATQALADALEEVPFLSPTARPSGLTRAPIRAMLIAAVAVERLSPRVRRQHKRARSVFSLGQRRSRTRPVTQDAPTAEVLTPSSPSDTGGPYATSESELAGSGRKPSTRE